MSHFLTSSKKRSGTIVKHAEAVFCSLFNPELQMPKLPFNLTHTYTMFFKGLVHHCQCTMMVEPPAATSFRKGKQAQHTCQDGPTSAKIGKSTTAYEVSEWVMAARGPKILQQKLGGDYPLQRFRQHALLLLLNLVDSTRPFVTACPVNRLTFSLSLIHI